jgi:tripartite-type tricarboxylate transporter receptor subunit TctC
MSTAPSIALPHLRDGAIKAYAVLAKDRMAVAPDLPTSDEAGLPEFYFSVWAGLWVPKGTPRDIIDRLHAGLRDALADHAVRQRLAALAIETPAELGPEALGALHKAEIEKWWPIIRAAGLKGE